MTGTIWDRIFANLIAALESISASTSDASTTVDQDSAAAGTTLYVTATTNFTAGQAVLVNRGGAREEIANIVAVNAGVSLTVSALTYTHTAVQKDTVEQGWYWHTVTNAKSFAGLKMVADGAPPLCGAMATGQSPYEGGELWSGVSNWTRGVDVILMDHVNLAEPLDQDNDSKFQKLLSDLYRAILADRTRGGYAMETRILEATPITEGQIEDKTSEMPFVGALVKVEIDYRHQIGKLYV